ncbi:ubiquinol oxidase subunit II [Thioclava sp. SK-1]|uniref:ubiquinol oxidase subunit II n=1 Tax=Thioclava sp. SK-1 TaxID=1889770 RepID=UPI0021011972|nr:ubiquinol oxidase subunit II [Thioclava sp. SK-1]
MLLAAVSLAGCQYDVLVPKGWVGAEQRDLLIISTLLMLIVIIPVLVMAVYFPIKYRADREDTSDYTPEWSHSTKLEIWVWGVPIAIVVALGWFTAVYTHRLDPYRSLEHLTDAQPLEVQAVSLDWKWLFIYPELGVASVNELAIPEGRPINISLSSSTVMNTFWVPALGGMIYSMTGMETKLHLIADETGTFASRSGHYSGPGFDKMVFNTESMTATDFDSWVAKVRAEGDDLSAEAYLQLEKPVIDAPISYYASVDDGLFDRIVGMCVEAGKVCMADMMMQDKMGGGGLAGIGDKDLYEYDRQRSIDGFGNPLDLPAPQLHSEPDDTQHMSALDPAQRDYPFDMKYVCGQTEEKTI